MVDLRFRRGDTWRAGRVCSAGLCGMFVATSTPPKLGEVVDLEMTFHDSTEEDSIVVTSVVVSVLPRRLHGPAGFSARMLPCKASRDVEALMQSRRRVGLTFGAPPPRRESRYPVRSAIVLKHGDTTISSTVMNLSTSGFCVTGTSALRVGSEAEFYLKTVEEQEPIVGRARVVRVLERSSVPGVGCEIRSLAGSDEGLYECHVQRVSQRSKRVVVVGANGERLVTLCRSARAAGYEVRGADSLGKIGSHFCDVREPDLVVLDETLARELPTQSTSLRAEFRMRRTLSTSEAECSRLLVKRMDSALGTRRLSSVDLAW